jgi:hypothetical protein
LLVLEQRPTPVYEVRSLVLPRLVYSVLKHRQARQLWNTQRPNWPARPLQRMERLLVLSEETPQQWQQVPESLLRRVQWQALQTPARPAQGELRSDLS